MSELRTFSETFDSYDTSRWYSSNFALEASWNQTAWSEIYVTTPVAGEVALTFDGTDLSGKPFTGAEIQSIDSFSYGTYEVQMQASDVSGVVSAFFLFNSEYFGADEHNEIDIEFLGNDTTVMNINYYHGDSNLGASGSVQVALGFDAASAMHTYSIEWMPDGIRWYADGTLLYEIDSATAPIAVPDEDMRIYSSLWTGAEQLEDWHGPIDEDATAQVNLSSVSYVPYAVESAGAEVSFAGQTEALVVDMAAGTWMRALRLLPIGDSLTEGMVNANLPVPEDRTVLDGYRLDLFERVIAGGGWVDYVGGLQNGPDSLLDPDHHGVAGKYLSAIVDDSSGTSDFSYALEEYNPDIAVFLAGTNDYHNNGEAYLLSDYLPQIVDDTLAAIEQFYAFAGNENRYFVVSTLPPKARGGVDPDWYEFINDGYSMVDGVAVVGDAGNGTFVAGIRDTVASLQSTYPTLVLFDNPITDIGDLTYDLIHFSEYAYMTYAEALYDTLQAEIGLDGSGFPELVNALPASSDVTGGEAGDRLGGNAAANTLRGGGGDDYLEGRAGADTLEGGSGKDVYAFGLDALDGSTDTILDYSAADGDVLDLGAIIDAYGWSDAEIAANVAITDGAAGAEVSITTPSGTFVLALVQGVAAADVSLSTTQFTQVFTREEELLGTDGDNLLYDVDEGRAIYGFAGRDVLYGRGGDDSIYGGTGLDKLYGGSGADTFYYRAEDLDSSRDSIFDFSIAEGDKLDLSDFGVAYGWTASELLAQLQLQENSGTDLRVSLNTPDGLQKFLYIYGVTKDEMLNSGALILEAGPAPDSGDDDGNMALSVPDDVIDASEASAVVVTLTGLDDDATAVVTLVVGGSELTQTALADGDYVFALTGLPDGPVTTSVTATDGGGNASTVSGPTMTLDAASDTSADEDGNLAVAAPDTEISESEFEAVVFNVTGLDADATAVVTVSDGAGGSVDNAAAPLGTNGSVVLDLSALADGALTVTVTATDATGNVASVAGPAMTLDKTLDATADADGNLAITAPDTSITLGEEGAVVFSVFGIDDDATAIVTVSDSLGGSVSNSAAPLSGDGDVVFDLSSLSDGALTVSVTAADEAGNSASVSGPTVTLSTAEAPSVPEPTITGTSGDDNLNGGGSDDVIAGLAGNDNIKGRDGNDWLLGDAGNDTMKAGAGDDTLVGGLGADALTGEAGADLFLITAADLDGSIDDIKDFTGAEGDVIELRDIIPDGLSDAELSGYIQVWKAGTVGELQVDSSGTGSSWVTLAYIRNGGDFTFDAMYAAGEIVLTSSGPPPDSGDDDGNMGLSAPDTNIDASENSAVVVTLSGLDSDATAIVTLSADGTDLTQTALANGDLVFDLTSLPDGPVTSSVTATDGNGNASTVSGPTLTLDTAPDTSADEDGDLAVSAPDTAITYGEDASVEFVVSGLDSDATAVVTVSDEAGGSVDNAAAPLGANGSLSLDLSSLADGTLTVQVTATDGSGNVASVSGPAVAMDTTEPSVPPGALVGTDADDDLRDGNDGTLIMSLGGNDRIIANGGDDTLLGGDGDDFLRGDNGDDVLDGGAGSDTLRGQSGADVFVFSMDALDGSTDRIDNYSGGSGEGDTIDLSAIVSGYGWSEAEASSHVVLTQYGSGVYLDLVSTEVTQTLADIRSITLSDISMDDFVLV
ncbi:family 16 glycosylhydrolase [Citreicella sp. C3M06]|uniref:family 16 glycosylhydrolase n=1 Tax=Citreicella sp. C3M06 TaxID=2841564 RepID=UPI001C0825B3|nr:family 16 glycosylhydrolase [Citreicella sp. C3M06]MBU2960341.1 family 16 glycosylhydrolase [Citreicella sp. C3M06]